MNDALIFEYQTEVKRLQAIDRIKSAINPILGNLKVLYAIAGSFEAVECYGEAIEFLEMIQEAIGKNDAMQAKASLAIGRNYFLSDNFERAKQVLDDLLNSTIDSKIALDARMILLTIQQK